MPLNILSYLLGAASVKQDPPAPPAPPVWTKIASDEIEVSTDSTTQASAGEIEIPDFDHNKILWVRIRDKAGPRNGYFYGSDAFFLDYWAANGGTTSGGAIKGLICLGVNDSGDYTGASSVGVWPYSIKTTDPKKITLYKKYAASTGTVDGTYSVDVYTITPPEDAPIFEQVSE